MVEFNNPVIPEVKYWAPQVNNPCPPKNKVTPRMRLSFHCWTEIR